MLLPSGRANTRCSVCRFNPGRSSRFFTPTLASQPGTGLESPETGRQARNGFGEPRDREAKSTLSRPRPAEETARPALEPAKMPAKCALFVRDRETPVRIGLRGGPGRIRTSNQTVMSGRL